jgi:hypothetical protein
MALIAFDGFDNYAPNGVDLISRRGGSFQWNINNGGIVTPGRDRTGGCVAQGQVGFGQSVGLAGTLTNPLNTLFFGVAIKFQVDSFSGNSPTIGLSHLASNENQLVIGFDVNTCGIFFNRFSNTGGQNTIGGTPNNVFTNAVWFYFEARVFIHPTAGSIIARINGVTVATLSGLNTKSSATTDLIDTISLNGAGAPSGITTNYDDFYIADTTPAAGAYPFSDFVGDVRVETLYPIGNVGTPAWTPFPPPGGVLPGAHRYWRLLINQSADTFSTAIAELSLAATPGGANLIGTGTISASSVSQSAHAAAFAVDGDPATYWASNTASPLPGQWLVYDFGAGVTQQIVEVKLTAGAFLNGDQFAPSEFQLQWSNDNSNWTSAWNFRSAVWTAGTQQTFTITTLTNWMEVTEDNNDGDVSYNSTATVGAQDMFNFQPLTGNAPIVLAVQTIGSYRKDDAGTRNVSPVLTSGGTTVTAAARQLATLYAYYVDLYPLDPNTGAAWTVAAVDALQAGYTLSG